MINCKYFGLNNSYIEHTKPNSSKKVTVFLKYGKNCISCSSFYINDNNNRVSSGDINDHLINEYSINFLQKYNLLT